VVKQLDRFRHEQDNESMIRHFTSFVLILASVGCAGRDSRPINYAVREAPSADRSASLDAAEATLVSLGYTVARRDTAGGVLITQPIAIEGAAGHTVRADNPVRRIAEVRLTDSDTGPKIHCKVIVQEQATESYRTLAFERGGDDLPGHQTAIDRDAGTTAEQNTAWRTLRRDKAAEREILDRLTMAAGTP
jgi:hypothetical protein